MNGRYKRWRGLATCTEPWFGSFVIIILHVLFTSCAAPHENEPGRQLAERPFHERKRFPRREWLERRAMARHAPRAIAVAPRNARSRRQHGAAYRRAGATKRSTRVRPLATSQSWRREISREVLARPRSPQSKASAASRENGGGRYDPRRRLPLSPLLLLLLLMLLLLSRRLRSLSSLPYGMPGMASKKRQEAETSEGEKSRRRWWWW